MNATARADAYRRQRGHHRSRHREVAGWVNGDGTRGIECACGTCYDGFDDSAQMREAFAHHVTVASMTPRQRRRYRHKANRELREKAQPPRTGNDQSATARHRRGYPCSGSS